MPDRILDWLKLFLYRVFPYQYFRHNALMGIGLMAYTGTEHPGPIITNGMGPVIE